MKNTISYVLWTLLYGIMIVTVITLISVFSVINKANAYHQTCIAEIQASNFASSVVEKYTMDTDPYITTIVDRTVATDDENLERTGRIYEVVTTYKINIGILNYHTTKTIRGFAR